MISEDTKFLLALRALKGIGNKFLNDLVIATEKTGMTVQECFYSFHSGKPVLPTDSEFDLAIQVADEQASTAKKFNHTIISSLDPHYPKTLKGLRDAPAILYCAGNLDLLNKDIITIIGTRSPTEHGTSIARKITEWFSKNDWVVASGLAFGVDTIAHEECLNAGGETIGVLAHGLEKVYPAKNKNLAKRILDNRGLMISEYGYNSYVGKSNFVERDRIQAALAKAVVLVQSDLKGGSLHASRAILGYDRYLVVVGQSAKDIANGENKIAANMLLFNGSDTDKSSLLKCKKNQLNNVLLMPDKSYLEQVSSVVRSVSTSNKFLESGSTYSMF